MVYHITSFSHSWPSVCLCQTANALLSMFVRPALKFCSFPALCFILGLYWSYFTGVTGFKASPFVSAILRHDRQNLNVQHSCSTSPRTWRQWAVNSPVLVCALASGAVVSPCCWGQSCLLNSLFSASSLGSRTCGEKSVAFPAHASFPRPNVNI